MGPDPGPAGTGAADPPAVRLEGLTKQLRHGVTAVDHLDLEVPTGSVTALLGPNGSGKTVTLRMLLGLVRPTHGRVLLFGQEVRPGARVLGRVGALVDGPGFVPHLSGRRNLELAVRLVRLSGGDADLDVALAMADLGDAADRGYATYSHGMRYRLAMAQALLGSPDLLVLDEPTTGMDPAQAVGVHRAIGACAAAGTTVVLTSHALPEIEGICDRAAVLRSGRLLAEGTIAELLGTEPRLVVEVDDTDRAATVLAGLPGAPSVTPVGPRTLAVVGGGLGTVAVLEHLEGTGVRVLGVRAGNLEDSYLALLGDPAADPPDAADR